MINLFFLWMHVYIYKRVAYVRHLWTTLESIPREIQVERLWNGLIRLLHRQKIESVCSALQSRETKSN